MRIGGLVPKFMFQINFSKTADQGLLKAGAAKRREVLSKTAKAAGGKLESFYFAFGQYDGVCIMDLPDNMTAASISLAVGASGAGEQVTTPLLTVEEVDQAVKKHVDYKAPGQ